MGLVSKLLGQDHGMKRHALGETNYLDLGEMEVGGPETQANVWVRVAEINKLDDFRDFAHHVYDGHVLIMDVRKIATDEILLRRFTNEVRKVADDVGGDLAGIAEHMVMLTPGGVKVDKHKLRVGK